MIGVRFGHHDIEGWDRVALWRGVQRRWGGVERMSSGSDVE